MLNGGMVMCSGRVGVEASRSYVVWLEHLGTAEDLVRGLLAYELND